MGYESSNGGGYAAYNKKAQLLEARRREPQIGEILSRIEITERQAAAERANMKREPVNPHANFREVGAYLTDPNRFNYQGKLRAQVRSNLNPAAQRTLSALQSDKPYIDWKSFSGNRQADDKKTGTLEYSMAAGGVVLWLDERNRIVVTEPMMGEMGVFEVSFTPLDPSGNVYQGAAPNPAGVSKRVTDEVTAVVSPQKGLSHAELLKLARTAQGDVTLVAAPNNEAQERVAFLLRSKGVSSDTPIILTQVNGDPAVKIGNNTLFLDSLPVNCLCVQE